MHKSYFKLFGWEASSLSGTQFVSVATATNGGSQLSSRQAGFFGAFDFLEASLATFLLFGHWVEVVFEVPALIAASVRAREEEIESHFVQANKIKALWKTFFFRTYIQIWKFFVSTVYFRNKIVFLIKEYFALINAFLGNL